MTRDPTLTASAAAAPGLWPGPFAAATQPGTGGVAWANRIASWWPYHPDR